MTPQKKLSEFNLIFLVCGLRAQKIWHTENFVHEIESSSMAAAGDDVVGVAPQLAEKKNRGRS